MRRWKSIFFVVPIMVFAAVAVSAAGPPGSGELSWADAFLAKAPGSNMPPPPDPNTIMQGGDTCATATVIGGLPYTDDGTTVGYTDDYDEECPYTGSTSPDVVYAFTPAANMGVDITLCVGTTNYDTKLYVYEGSCPGGGAVGCSDDDCTAPIFGSPYNSSLTNVSMTGGQTYYIVVDGYDGASGPYSIEITEWQPPPPPTECDGPELLYYQTPDGPNDPWNAANSGQTTEFDYTLFDNFTSADFSITDYHWWGLSLFFDPALGWTACDPTGLTFDVKFYADNAGEPGAELCSFAGLSPAPVNTGVAYSGYDLFYWEVTGLAPACEPTGETWVSIHSYANAAECTLLAMSGTGGDGSLLQFDGAVYTPQAYDMSLCITGIDQPPPPEEAIPTLGTTGILLLIVLIGGVGLFVMRRLF